MSKWTFDLANDRLLSTDGQEISKREWVGPSSYEGNISYDATTKSWTHGDWGQWGDEGADIDDDWDAESGDDESEPEDSEEGNEAVDGDSPSINEDQLTTPPTQPSHLQSTSVPNEDDHDHDALITTHYQVEDPALDNPPPEVAGEVHAQETEEAQILAPSNETPLIYCIHTIKWKARSTH